MGALTYRNVLAETEALFDYQLQQMALSLRDQGEIASAQADTLADEQLDFVVQIWTVDGRSIYASRAALVAAGARAARPGHAQRRRPCLAHLQRRDARARDPDRAAGRDPAAARRARRLAQRPAAAAMALLAALVIWWLAARNLAPLDRLAGEVRARRALAGAGADGGLPDEVSPLARALNALLERLRRRLDAQRVRRRRGARAALAAHRAEAAARAAAPRRRRRDRAAARDAIAAGIERAARLVEQLLTLARSEPGAAPHRARTRRSGRDRAPRHRRDGRLRVARRRVRARRARRRRSSDAATRWPWACSFAISSDNAARYSPAGLARRGVGTERRAPERARHPRSSTTRGPGIPEAERQRVFDRFYRRAEGGELRLGAGPRRSSRASPRRTAPASRSSGRPRAGCAPPCAFRR